MAENKNRRFFENDTLITSFVPPDLTDVGQGTLLYEAYHHKLRYCEGVGWIVYGEGTWTQSETVHRDILSSLPTFKCRKQRLCKWQK